MGSSKAPINQIQFSRIIILILLLSVSIIFIHTSEVQGLVYSDEKIEVSVDQSRTLSVSYIYPEGEWSKELPGVVVFHGYSSSKEMMCPVAKLLAKSGFAVLTVDLQGHGQSTGKLGEDGDNSLSNDGLAAVEYLRAKNEVNSSIIGPIAFIYSMI